MMRQWLPLLMVLVACGDDPGSCPDHSDAPTEFLESGTFAGSDTCASSSCEIVFAPRDGATDYELELDLEAGIATIRFQRDGVLVEERWRITSREPRG